MKTNHFKATNILCVVLFSVCSYNLNAQENSSYTDSPILKRAKIETSYAMRGASYTEGPDEAQLVQLLFNPKLELKINNSFSLSADATLSLNSSRVQTRFDNPSVNAINANEILFSYTLKDSFKTSVGAINQKHLASPWLAQSGLAFPGAIASYEIKGSTYSLKAKVQYTIPNSTSLESDRTGSEDLPIFQTQGAEFNWKPKTWFNLTANVNHFSYSKLPSIVAYNSGRLGNDVVGVTQSESSFAYDFDGISQMYHFDFNINKKYSPFLTIKSVDNFEAPSDRQRAQSLTAGLGINFKNHILTPTLGLFYAESDAAPAVYTDARFGRNNRDGQMIGLKTNFKKLGFSIDVAYVNSDLITPKPVQSDMEYLEVFVEVANVKF